MDIDNDVWAGISISTDRKFNFQKRKLSSKQKNWWLIAHIFFIIIAFSGLIGQLLLTSSTTFITDREHIFAAHLFIVYFDDYLIIPGAFGSLITGIWLAVRTHWGFTKHYWIIAKWIGNIAAILLGSTIIGGFTMHSRKYYPNPFIPCRIQLIFTALRYCPLES